MSSSDYQTDNAGVLAQAIDDAIKRRLLDVHTVIPGIVESYDKANQVADISVAINRFTASGEEIKGPKLPNVPVCFTRSSGGHIIWPLQSCDEVAVFFCERDIDAWRSESGQQNPLSARKFSLTDSFCMPGLVSDKNAPTRDSGDDDNLTVYFGGAKIVVTSDGKLKLGQQGSSQTEPLVLGNVVKDFLEQLTDKMQTVPAGITTGPGELIVINPTYISEIAALVAEFLTNASTNIVSQTSFTER